MHVKNISLFGAYYNCNFGDDLMAYLIAESLEQEGYSPVLWKGPEEECIIKNWKKTGDIDDFLSTSSHLIIGGGMWLSNSSYSELWNDLKVVTEACEKKRIPITAISIGSDNDFENLNSAAKYLLNSPALIAIAARLDSDLDFIRKNTKEKKITHHHDIVLTSSTFAHRRKLRKVLFCIPTTPAERFMFRIFMVILRLFGYRFHSISQFSDKSENSKNFYRIKGSHKPNSRINDVLAAVRDCDILIGSGLHVGVSALASGARFISYGGSGKTRKFMNEIGTQGLVIDRSSKINKLLAPLRTIVKILSLRSADDSELTSEKRDASRHYDFMLESIRKPTYL